MEKKIRMNIFKNFECEMSYKDIIQLDGAFSAAHINYGKLPVFNGINGKNIAQGSRRNSLLPEETILDVLGELKSFNGTEKDFNKNDRIALWEIYWFEYINAFDKLITFLPRSVVTIYVGRQAIEIGIKYLLFKKSGQVIKTHDLGKLMKQLYIEYNINNEYMDYVDVFCEKYCEYIEGGNAEYFRFPEYKGNSYFAGNRLDIQWLCYNFSLIILKLIHMAEVEGAYESIEKKTT